MFSANIQPTGTGRRQINRRRRGHIVVGSAFGIFALLWSGLIIYIGLAARAELVPMDVLTCQATVGGELKPAAAASPEDGKPVSCDRKLARMGHPS